jgi:two-component system LytT family response regulator
MTRLRVVVADDERPARRFLLTMLADVGGVEVVGEAESGAQAIEAVQSLRPDLVLLDLQMPELSGLEVARRLGPDSLTMFAFVTAFDDHAIEAFELNAIDYLLKPVQRHRLEATLARARDRMAAKEPPEARAASLARAIETYRTPRPVYADRIPVRVKDNVLLLPVRQIASVVSDGEMLRIATTTGESFTISHRLHALEARLDPRRFLRLGRGTLVNVDLIARVSPMPGGTYLAVLTTGQELPVSRSQSRVLRETLLKL